MEYAIVADVILHPAKSNLPDMLQIWNTDSYYLNMAVKDLG